MKTNSLVKLIVIFLVFTALQIFWVKDFAFFNVAFCFLYIAIIISLPLDIATPILLFLAFAIGFVMDIFYDTMGIHAAACVFITYIRPTIIRLLTPLGGYDDETEISISTMGIRWYIFYVLILVGIHLTFMFTLEAGGFQYFYWTLAKIFASLFFTTFMIVSLKYLFFTHASR